MEQVEQQLALKSIREQYVLGTAVRTSNKQFRRLAPARSIDVATIAAPWPAVAGTHVDQFSLSEEKRLGGFLGLGAHAALDVDQAAVRPPL